MKDQIDEMQDEKNAAKAKGRVDVSIEVHPRNITLPSLICNLIPRKIHFR